MSSPLHRSAASALFFFFFFNDTATTEIYTLSLHDALPISCRAPDRPARQLLGHLRVHRALRSPRGGARSEEHTSELQSRLHLVCRLLLEKKKNKSTAAGGPNSRRTIPRTARTRASAPRRAS